MHRKLAYSSEPQKTSRSLKVGVDDILSPNRFSIHQMLGSTPLMHFPQMTALLRKKEMSLNVKSAIAIHHYVHIKQLCFSQTFKKIKTVLFSYKHFIEVSLCIKFYF
jgi:hypothetical protein